MSLHAVTRAGKFFRLPSTWGPTIPDAHKRLVETMESLKGDEESVWLDVEYQGRRASLRMTEIAAFVDV